LVVAVFTPPANVPLAPLAGGVNVTSTPLTGLFPASVTVATSGAANAVLMVAFCPEPLVAATLAAGPALFVSEKFADVAPVALATTLYGPPAVALAVKTAEVATPLALVVAVFTPPAKVPLAPAPGGVKVTSTPLTGLFPASVTVATKGAANAVLIGAFCPEPLVAATFAAGPVRLVIAKFADVSLGELATTLYGPAMELAVNVAEVATPLALVVAVFTPPAKVPLAPPAGGVKVTTTPLTGLLPASVTVATNGAANAALMVALCPEPLVMATFPGGTAVFVREKFADVAPVALATTL
jgi:NADH:ubiquinone oxidoreductase subunit K